MSRISIFTPLILCLVLSAIGTSGQSTQIDLRFGESDFFIGEKFLITLNDVIYWMGGICIGFIFAVFYILAVDFKSLKQAKTKNKVVILKQEDENSNNVIEEIGNATAAPRDREGRLIGSKKYPTLVEERVLKAVHTDPSNYFDNPEGYRREARLIGSIRVPTILEDRVLKRLDEEMENSFGN